MRELTYYSLYVLIFLASDSLKSMLISCSAAKLFHVCWGEYACGLDVYKQNLKKMSTLKTTGLKNIFLRPVVGETGLKK